MNRKQIETSKENEGNQKITLRRKTVGLQARKKSQDAAWWVPEKQYYLLGNIKDEKQGGDSDNFKTKIQAQGMLTVRNGWGPPRCCWPGPGGQGPEITRHLRGNDRNPAA